MATSSILISWMFFFLSLVLLCASLTIITITIIMIIMMIMVAVFFLLVTLLSYGKYGHLQGDSLSHPTLFTLLLNGHWETHSDVVSPCEVKLSQTLHCWQYLKLWQQTKINPHNYITMIVESHPRKKYFCYAVSPVEITVLRSSTLQMLYFCDNRVNLLWIIHWPCT